jgi:hypothetical protein
MGDTGVPATEQPEGGESFEPRSSPPAWAIEGNHTSKQTTRTLIVQTIPWRKVKRW